jgi:ribosomal protein S18 acetylase RimI-like enzyme
MDIEYKVNAPVSAEQFVELLRESTLGQRRPLDDLTCMQGMLDHANLMVSAWRNKTLIGIARSVTDFHFACYLSDLAVDRKFQRQGIGKTLLILTQQRLGPKCALILLAAPAANAYYEPLGFKNNPRCWVLEGNQTIIG